ncbi:hypothetical protein NQ314_005693 [Rhamnusium bicolor]|uniref:Uncharacterized protein n=1 Tax=Rhamnusium bicolor TaxID=1586634 RepID=A0AAV8ZHY0_9CUCU|nr:hypothetical protein NQ314_005693 [Rhamnusium bicolor]
MFFTIIGVGVFTYSFIYIVLSLISDCDLELLFYEKFGKSPRRLKGKVVFITGASSGIGEYTAYALAKFGVKLVLTARRNDELQRVKRQCIGRSQRAQWENIDLSVDKQVFDLNVFGVVNLTRVALDHFNKTGGGQVAVVSSLAGIIGAPYSASYTGAKHAIHKYNVSVKPTDKRMTAERCGYLNAVALVNKTKESWMAISPIMVLTYGAVYCPIIFKTITIMLGPEFLFNLRDSKNFDEVHIV